MGQTSPTDPLERVWVQLFVGDAPGNRTLFTTTDGRSSVEDARPDGGVALRTIRVGSTLRQIDVPSYSSQLLVADATLAEVADTLEAQRQADQAARLAAMTAEQQIEQAEREAGWERYFAEERRRQAATRTEVEPLGRLDDWLRQQDDPSGLAADVAAGRDHRCLHCDGSGRGSWLTCNCVPLDDQLRGGDPDPDCVRCDGQGRWHEPCTRCAATGRRVSRVTVVLIDETGHRCELTLDASKVDLEAVTTAPPPSSRRSAYTRMRLSVAHLADELAAAGVAVPSGGAVLLDVAGDARVFDGTKSGYGTDVAAVVKVFLRLLPGGVHPDRAPSWMSPRALQRNLAECRFDEDRRVVAREVRLRALRPLSAAWAELVDHARTAESALPDGWQAQLLLATGFIATGEHGPQAALVAVPPNPLARPTALLSTLDHSLDRTVESLVSQARSVDLAELARTAADGTGELT